MEDKNSPLVPANRVAGIDAYRGIVMFLLLAEVLQLRHLHDAFPENGWWRFLAHHQSHVPWTGCSLHDLIQPSFTFLVGVALPYSLASRLRRGHSHRRMFAHAAWRAVLLTLLGIILRSQHCTHTNFTFEDTLSQIGLGYLPLFLLGFAKRRWQWLALAVILVGYWAACILHPAPGNDFDYQAVGVSSHWPHHATGISSHFNMNSNLAWAFDTWFLNLFPRDELFTHNPGGYCTLSFIPTLATMILGLLAGNWLKEDTADRRKIVRLILAGVVSLGLGMAVDASGLCPSVKRIWTPAWVLVSGGWCFLMLAACYGVCDLLSYRAWAFPFMVIGANSIIAYCLAHGGSVFVIENLRIHFGQEWSHLFGTAYAPLVEGTAVLIFFYLLLLWMYRRRIFVRI